MMKLIELIEANDNFVTRRDLTNLFGNKEGSELYNLGFNALGPDVVMKRVVLAQRTAKVVEDTKVAIEFMALLQFLGRVIAAPQNTYLQSIKSHELWASREQYIYTCLEKEGLHKPLTELRQVVVKAKENAEG